MTDDVHARATRLEADAAAQLRQGDPASAERTVVSAIEWVEATDGLESPWLITLLRLLAKILRPPSGTAGDRPVVHIQRALELARTHGLPRSTLASIHAQAGGALDAAGRLVEAREMHRQALELARLEGKDVAYHLSGLASVVGRLSQTEAVPLWEELVALEAHRSTGSSSHMMALASLGECLLAAGRDREAVAPLQGALAILEAHTQGAPHRWAQEFRSLLERARGEGT